MGRLGAIIAVTLVAAPIAAQQEAFSPPTFRGGTDVVQVEVVAQDKNARFVTDLAADEFEIQDDGELQRIDFVRLIKSDVAAPAGTPIQGPRLFVALFDTTHLTPAALKRVQGAALALFSKDFQSGDLGGVVADGRLANNRFSADREELLAAVRNARPGQRAGARTSEQAQWPRVTDVEAFQIVVNQDGGVFEAVKRRACAEDANLCNLADASVRAKATQLTFGAQAESAQTLQTLMTLLNGLSRFDGRKTVLLLTEGFFVQESWPLVQDAIGQAARTNVRIYVLDARGLDRSGMADRQLDFSDDPMNSLAVDTGGFVVRNVNYFDGAVSQIASDARTYYMLGYRPRRLPDGAFHKITVRVRRPGVAIRARRGYVATVRPAGAASASSLAASATSPSVSLPSGAAFAAVSASGQDSTDIRSSDAHVAVDRAAVPSDRGEPGGAVVTNANPSSGYRLRPDAGKHVDLLLRSAPADDPAAAGWTAYQRGDVTAAREALKAAAARPSVQPWVHYALGMADYALRDYSGAVGEWETVRRAAADFEPVYFDLVDGFLQLKEHDQAIRVLRAAKERWPHDVEVYNALGVVQTVRGALDDAIKSFQEAIAAKPEEATSYFNLARALEMRYVRSRRYVQQLRAWVTNEQDRATAVDNYRKYLELGGPFTNQAQDGLSRLRWEIK